MAKEKTYESLWKKKLQVIKIQIKNSINSVKNLQMNKADFIAAGNRKEYSFTIKIKNGLLDNYPTGSVVGGNLYEVLVSDIEVKKILLNRNIKIRMDENFILWFEENN